MRFFCSKINLIEYTILGDKMDEAISVGHSITINERKNIVITGVKKIDSFDDEEFLVETNMGYVIIKGKDLEIIKLDTYQGNISIKGRINSLNYVESPNKKDKEDSLIGKLFK